MLPDLDHIQVPDDVLGLVPAETAGRHLLIPINRVGKVLSLVAPEDVDQDVVDDVARHTGLRPRVFPADSGDLERAYRRLYGEAADRRRKASRGGDDVSGVLQTLGADELPLEVPRPGTDDPAERLLRRLLADAANARADEIAVSPAPQGCQVNLRVGGRRRLCAVQPRRLTGEMLLLAAVMGGVDEDQARTWSWTSTFRARLAGRPYEVTVRCHPTAAGPAAEITGEETEGDRPPDLEAEVDPDHTRVDADPEAGDHADDPSDNVSD